MKELPRPFPTVECFGDGLPDHLAQNTLHVDAAFAAYLAIFVDHLYVIRRIYSGTGSLGPGARCDTDLTLFAEALPRRLWVARDTRQHLYRCSFRRGTRKCPLNHP